MLPVRDAARVCQLQRFVRQQLADACLRLRDVEVAADLPREEVVDLAVPWHRGRLAGHRIDVDGMAAALAQEATAMRLQMPDQLDALHRALGLTPRVAAAPG